MFTKLPCFLAFIFLASALCAQITPSPTSPPPQTRPRQGHQPSCMQQAGIEESVIEQIQSIARDARSQVDSICSNSSLTPRQKRQQVRDIRQQAMQKRASLITADQQQALTACQQARSANHPNNGRQHEGLGGGCGELPPHGSRPGGSDSGASGNESGTPPPSSQSSPQS